jgi:DNA primase
MISQKTIDQVRDDLDFASLAELLVPDLKKHGATYEAPCPFPSHAERTPSFKVNPAKRIYKCFGCGKGGHDNIKFVMDIERLDFPAAVRFLADKFNITIEETELTPEAKEQQLKRADYIQINRQVADIYSKQLADIFQEYNGVTHDVIQELNGHRQLTQETINTYELGFAIDSFKTITNYLIERNHYQPAIELGLIITKVGTTTTYDNYRNRIMFPIHNEFGEVIGFGGRKMEDPTADEKYQKAPKYINSADSLLYKKDGVLYGLYQAGPHIKRMGFACVVEGYFDVTAFSQTGMPNTVAPCGTALTEKHAKLLKRYTNHVVLIGDGDEAGMKANLRAVDVLLKESLRVDICPLPEKEDPDSFARKFYFLNNDGLVQNITVVAPENFDIVADEEVPND